MRALELRWAWSWSSRAVAAAARRRGRSTAAAPAAHMAAGRPMNEGGTGTGVAAGPPAPGPAPTGSAPPESSLGPGDLQQFLRQHSISAAALALEEVEGGPAGAAAGLGACRVKSLVFLAAGAPLVVVLPLDQKVDRRRLAAALGLRPTAVALAPQDQLIWLCGYPMGSVPPLGHQPRLPVVVDAAVAGHSHCVSGGGGEGTLLLLPLEDLLRVTGAVVAGITKASVDGSGSSMDSGSESEVGWLSRAAGAAGAVGVVAEGGQQEERQEERAETGAALALPVPWQPGSEMVTIEGLVSQKRKMAALLLFVNLVPLPAEGGPVPLMAPGSGTYLRRLWSCPEGSGRTCEVQLILGKTLAGRLGSESAVELIRKLKVGQCVRIVGRPQPHAQPPHGTRRAGVLDVVVHEIELIDPPAFPAAGPTAAGQLSAMEGAAVQPPQPAAAAVVAAATSRGSAQPAGRGGGRAGGGKAQLPLLELPPAVQEGTVVVDSPQGLLLLGRALFGADSASDGDGTEAPGDPPAAVPSSCSEVGSSRGGDFCAVVGMDCEWQPYQRGEPHTPVALLQLAVRRWQPSGGRRQQQQQQQQEEEQEEGGLANMQVFLVDMLALCNSSSSLAAPQPGPAGPGEQLPGEQPPPLLLSEGERLLSGLLQRLFEDPDLAVVGFKLSHDLRRLCESYPHLPCFGSQGPVPFRSYIDVLHVAQAVLPEARPQGKGPGRRGRGRAGMGLSALAGLALGQRIDKTEQCSDWASRPLTPAQQAYAATDAFALVALYEELLARQLQQRLQGVLAPLSPTWRLSMAAGVSDVSAFRPSASSVSQGGGGSSGRAKGKEGRTQLDGGSWERRPGAAPLHAGGCSTLSVLCNVDHLLRRYLGQALPQGGKGPAVRAGAADSEGIEPRRVLRFPRGSGVLEWANAFMLFVNLQPAAPATADGGPAPAARYDNRFLWGREQEVVGDGQQAEQQLYITWWPGRGQTEEHPVMQRMLGRPPAPAPAASPGAPSGEQLAAAGAAGGQGKACEVAGEQGRDQDQEQQQRQPPAVLLFCRPPGGHYVFCGRLQPAGPSAEFSDGGSSGGGSGCLVWQLLDWPALQESPTFQGLLALQN